jgi:transcriptional regulator with XRE-family HTH domain
MNNNIKAERVRAGKTIAEVAKQIGTSPNSVYNWESAATEPNARSLVRLANLYDCSPDYLLDMTDERHGRAAPTA